jgi:hypothetical protein
MKPTGLVILSPPLADPGYLPGHYARTLWAYQRKLGWGCAYCSSSSVMIVPDAVWRLLYSTVTVSFHYYTYSHCQHEDLTPLDVTSAEITGVDCQGRLVSEARCCTIGTQKAYGWSPRRAPFLLACSFVFQLSVFSKMLYWLLPPASLQILTCFPLLPIAFHAYQRYTTSEV